MQQAPWQIGPNREVDLGSPRIMAILNLTPDSFSDGGELPTLQAVLHRAAEAINDGADLLDLGGESTRPGAQPVPASQQIDRVCPAIEAIARRWPKVPISVDTTRAEVAREAMRAGAAIINDVSAGLDDEAMLPTAAACGSGLILMHRMLPPDRDRYSDHYTAPPIEGDAVALVRTGLASRLQAAIRAGVPTERIVLDPGLGFGKTVEQNLDLIRRTGELLDLGRPVLSGASRKSFLGRVGLGKDSDPRHRLGASVAATVLHASAGARIFRVHDVGPHAQALRLWAAVLDS